MVAVFQISSINFTRISLDNYHNIESIIFCCDHTENVIDWKCQIYPDSKCKISFFSNSLFQLSAHFTKFYIGLSWGNHSFHCLWCKRNMCIFEKQLWLVFYIFLSIISFCKKNELETMQDFLLISMIVCNILEFISGCNLPLAGAYVSSKILSKHCSQ